MGITITFYACYKCLLLVIGCILCPLPMSIIGNGHHSMLVTNVELKKEIANSIFLTYKLYT
jgi:hypothetical protein